MFFEFIDSLTEGSTLATHLEHPEDLVFETGETGARRALDILLKATQRENSITMKYDGYPAIIFGRNVDGHMVVADKHMFSKKDGTGRVTSVQQFIEYDRRRGANRSDLYLKIQVLWPLLSSLLPEDFRGYYWGDLLWVGRPALKNGQFVFTPNTVTYAVDENSSLGKNIASSTAGIVIHQFLSDFDVAPTPITRQQKLPSVDGLCIVWPFLPTGVDLKQPVQLVNAAKAAIKQYGDAINSMLEPGNMAAHGVSDLPKLMKKYVNAGVRGDTRTFVQWLETSVNATKLRALTDEETGYLQQHSTAINGIFYVFSAIANVKLNLVAQLDSYQREIQQYVGNTPGGEGYVVSDSGISIKLVNRAAFSAANFANND